MPSIRLQLDNATFKSLEEIAPGAHYRADFIRQAIREAIEKRQNERIRETYLRHPDSEEEADDWSLAEAWEG